MKMSLFILFVMYINIENKGEMLQKFLDMKGGEGDGRGDGRIENL